MVKKYIYFNIDKRKIAASSNFFEKIFLKLMNNSVYGKKMEKLRKIINIRLVNNAKGYIGYTMKPSFVSQIIFNKNFDANHEFIPVLTLDKPIYVGFSI